MDQIADISGIEALSAINLLAKTNGSTVTVRICARITVVRIRAAPSLAKNHETRAPGRIEY
jgi:hypothetical protein